MALSWADAKRLARLHGIADELLTSARASTEPQIVEAADRQLGTVGHEIHALLEAIDPLLADEFRHVVLADQLGPVPPAVRGAAMAGWLHATLTTESLEQKAMQNATAEQPRRRKQTIGFKLRAPITRAESSSNTG
jgi:hypothetical protein